MPCPFCGGPGVIENTHTPHYWVECESCGCRVSDPDHGGPYFSIQAHLDSIANAARAWNTRGGKLEHPINTPLWGDRQPKSFQKIDTVALGFVDRIAFRLREARDVAKGKIQTDAGFALDTQAERLATIEKHLALCHSLRKALATTDADAGQVLTDALNKSLVSLLRLAPERSTNPFELVRYHATRRALVKHISDLRLIIVAVDDHNSSNYLQAANQKAIGLTETL